MLDKHCLPMRDSHSMKQPESKNGNSRGIYVGTWLPKSLHKKFRAICRRRRLTIAQVLEDSVRQVIKAEAQEAIQ